MNENDSQYFEVNLNLYSGPLNTLLDLAKAQKVDLEKLSITKLAAQFYEFITKSDNINLEVASEYLLIATWLTYLKSKLLLPESDEEEFKALDNTIEYNVIKSFSAGCNLVLHCNGKMSEMLKVAKNSPKIDNFIIKKTSQISNIIS